MGIDWVGSGARPAPVDRGPRTEAEVFEVVKTAVIAETGYARDWHVENLFTHEQRYRADLRVVNRQLADGPILELGSAPCHMTAILQLSGHEIVGVDIAPERVAGFIAAMRLDVRRCDIERLPLPFADGEFAGVLLCDTFEHLRIDPGFVLSEAGRVLRFGGFLLLTTPNVYSLPSMARYALGKSIADPLTEFGKLRRLGHMGHVREYSAREVTRFVEGCGLRVETVDYRYQANHRSRRGRLLGLAYRLVSRRFHRDIVVIARKCADGPRLDPL